MLPLNYTLSAATIMPCCTARIVCDHIIIRRSPSFNIFKDGDKIANLVIKVCGDVKIIQNLGPNRESSSGDGDGVAAVENGGGGGRIGKHGVGWCG
jgi:hypothetical protein